MSSPEGNSSQKAAQNAQSVKADQAELSEGLPVPRRHWAALSQLLAIGMSVLDSSMINVGLPVIAQDMGVSASSVVWVVNAYGLTIVVLLLPLSSVVGRFGLRNIFTIGVSVFMVGALVSALSVNLPMLLFGRVIQGFGAASIFCLSAVLVRSIYPVHLMSQGIGLLAMTVSTTAVVGPTLGSFILTLGSWRWMFVVMLPVGGFIWAIKKNLPLVLGTRHPFDVKSAVQSAIGIGFLILGLDFLVPYPWQSTLLIAVSLVLLINLIRRSALQTAPMLPVDLFRIKPLRYALAASKLSFGSQMAAFVSIPFYLQNVLIRDQLMIGLLMAGWPAGAAVMALVAGQLADRFPIPILCAIGAGCMALSLLAISLMSATVSDGWLLVCMVLGGVGFGFFQTPNNRVLLSSGPRDRLGALGGLQAITRVFGQTVGAAIVASAFALSQEKGSTYGLTVAICFATLAVLLNIYRQWGLGRHELA